MPRWTLAHGARVLTTNLRTVAMISLEHETVTVMFLLLVDKLDRPIDLSSTRCYYFDEKKSERYSVNSRLFWVPQKLEALPSPRASHESWPGDCTLEIIAL